MERSDHILIQRGLAQLEALAHSPVGDAPELRLRCRAAAALLGSIRRPPQNLLNRLQQASAVSTASEALHFVHGAAAILRQFASLVDGPASGGVAAELWSSRVFDDVLDALVLAGTFQSDELSKAADELFNEALAAPAFFAGAADRAAALVSVLSTGSDRPRLFCRTVVCAGRSLAGGTGRLLYEDVEDELRPLSWYARRAAPAQKRLAADSAGSRISLQDLSAALDCVQTWYVSGSMVCLRLKFVPMNQMLMIEVLEVEGEHAPLSAALDGWEVRGRQAGVELARPASTIEGGRATLALNFEIDPSDFRVEFRAPHSDQWIECFGGVA